MELNSVVIQDAGSDSCTDREACTILNNFVVLNSRAASLRTLRPETKSQAGACPDRDAGHPMQGAGVQLT